MKEEGITLGALTEDRVPQSGPSGSGDFTYVDISSIDRETKRIVGPKVLPSAKAPSRARQILKTGDVLVSMTRPNLNAVARVSADLDGAIASTGFHVLRGKHADSRFLFYAVQTPDFIGSLCQKVQGALYPAVRPEDISSFCLPPFSLSQQRRIVAKIEELFSELDEGVEALRQARAQLAVYRQALLKHAFEGKLTADWRKAHRDQLKPAAPTSISAEELGLLPSLPDGWNYSRFGGFIISIDAGKSFSCVERPPKPEEVGVAKVSAVTWGEYDETESKTCIDQSKVYPNYFIREGDFLLSRANTIELVGACVLVRRVTQRIMLSDKTLRLAINGLPKEYFLHFLRSRQGRREIESRSTGNQESMRNIGQDRIRAIVVPICSGGEAAEIVRRLDSQLSAIAAQDTDLAANLQKAEVLRQAILKQAFAGELVPQDPADEPASALLARIKAEPAANAKEPVARPARARASKSDPAKTARP